MATFDSTWCLARLLEVTGRPATDADLTAPIGYSFLTSAQLDVARELAMHIPHAMAVTEQMTTSDSLTYSVTFPILGYLQVFTDSRLDDPMVETGEAGGGDYFRAGISSITLTGGRTRTFSDGPYARYVPTPDVIDASTEPTLVPQDALWAVVWRAAEVYATRGGLRDPAPYRAERLKVLWGDPELGYSNGLIPAYKQSVSTSGKPGLGLWYRSADLG